MHHLCEFQTDICNINEVLECWYHTIGVIV